jgi:hypothetical protein
VRAMSASLTDDHRRICLTCTMSITVLALKSRYYLDGEKATLTSTAADIRILAYVEAWGGKLYLTG